MTHLEVNLIVAVVAFVGGILSAKKIDAVVSKDVATLKADVAALKAKAAAIEAAAKK